MATSLARQLASLRTPGSVASSLPLSVYSGPFLFPEAETEHSSISSLRDCVAESLSQLCNLDSSMARYSVLLDMEEGEEEAEKLVAECLTSLCPHLLLKHAQWVLQWLVTKHKVHMNNPSMLVFTVMPYYSYQIYQTVLNCIDVTLKHTKPGSDWLAEFKQNCVPTTQVALHRHTASNPAFLRFMCSTMVEIAKLVAKNLDMKVHKQTTLAMTTILGGLENTVNVSDENILMVMQVILSGFKSSNQDIISLSSILLSYLLAKVNFKQKTVTKLCKSLTKFSKLNPSQDTLYLVMLLARTQKVNMAMVMEIVLTHQPVVNSIVQKHKRGVEEESEEYLDSLLYSMALVMDHLKPPQGEVKMCSTQEENSFLDIILNIIKASSYLLEETAMCLMNTSVKLMKSLEDNSQTSIFRKKVVGIMEEVEKKLPEVFRVAMMNGSQGSKGDIFFLPGVEKPSDNQLEVSKMISSNQLVLSLSSKLLVDVMSSKGVKKILKSNNTELKKILQSDTTFLLTQIDPVKLEVLLINLIMITDNFPILQELSINHICSSSMLPFLTMKPILELHIIPLLFISPTSTSSAILSSPLASTSSILSLLTSISPANNSFKTAVEEKLSLLLTPSHLNTVFSTPSLLNSTTVLTTFFSLSNRLFRSSPDWAESFATLIGLCLKRMNIEKDIVSEDTVSRVMEAKDKSSLAWIPVMETVKNILSVGKDQGLYDNLLVALPHLMERGFAVEASELKQSLLEHLGTNSLNFLLLTASSSSDLKIVCLCLQEAACLCQEGKNVSKILKDKTDPSLLHLLSLLFHSKMRVQKAAYTVLEKLEMSNDSVVIMPMIKFFVSNKTEILNNIDNFPSILSREKVDMKACREMLTRSTQGQVELFIKLTPIFKCLSSTKDVDTIFKFGSECLEKDDIPACEAVKEIITQFTDVLISNLTTEKVWNFFTSCLSSKKIVSYSGLTKKISQLLLSSMASSTILTDKLKDKELGKLLACLVKFSMLDTALEARNLMLTIPPKPSMLLEQFQDIWGKESFSAGRVGGRGKFSLLYGSKDTSEEDAVKWGQTSWLLELMEKILRGQEKKDEGWVVLTRPLFVLLRKVVDMEVEDGTYKLSLLLSVLQHLLSCVPDQALVKMDTGNLDPELLVHCIRTCPSPDTRHAALQVLARCAVANPDFILQNSITIFTFMGSHLLKVDSKHSFQVACQALEVIIPAIKTACQAPGKAHQLQATCLGVLTTFVDASMDIPTHRLTEFLVRLINCLGDREHLWVAALLLVRKDKAGGERRVVELFSQLDVARGLEALLRLLVNTRSDGPHLRKMFGVRMERREEEATEKPDEWDVLRLRALQIVSQVLCASSFKRRVGQVLEEEEVGQMLNLLIEAAILTIKEYGNISVPMPVKLKKNLVNQSERVLEYSLSLLPPSLFLQLTTSLLGSKIPSVRQRALEVVSSKLSPPSPLPIPSLSPLVSPLVTLALTEEQPHTQQLALLAVRQLAKLLPDTEHLAPAAQAFSSSFLSKLSNPKVLGAGVLSCGDILTCLGPLGVSKVPDLVSWLCSGLESGMGGEEWTEKEVAVVQNSFLYCLQRLVETFVGFLHPLLPRLVALSCKLSGSSSPSTIGRSKMLLSCLATTIPPHTTLSLSTQLLEKVWCEASSVPAFVNFVADNCKRLERNQLSSVSKQVVELFTMALGYRTKPGIDMDSVNQVEESIISAFLTIALRLSLEDFIPVYHKLVSLHMVGTNSQLTTMFNLTSKVASKLKSLFSFGVESCLVGVTNILKEERPAELVSACLNSLTMVMTYNKVEMITIVQYEQLVATLLSPLVLTSPSLSPCLVQLTISTPDDTNWKHLHYQLLLILRDSRASIRLMILSVLTKCVTDRTDTYLPVLPDAVPFLQEILEDDDQTVEAACRDFIQHMETTFGQNLESYFV